MLYSTFTGRRACSLAAAALVLVTAAACQAPVNIEDADVPTWRDSVLPVAQGDVALEDSGKILNRDPLLKDAAPVAAGTYTLTMVCDGGGKAYFAVSSAGKNLADAAAACNGNRDVVKINVPVPGPVSISTSSVDAPLMYAYHLAAAGN